MLIKDIQEKYHINDKHTISNWARAGKWREIKDLTEVKAKEKFAEQMSDWMVKQAKLGEFMQRKGKQVLEYKDPTKIKVFEATDMIRTGANLERQSLAPEDRSQKSSTNVVIYLPQIKETNPQEMKTIDMPKGELPQ
jgi:hypothetical protein